MRKAITMWYYRNYCVIPERTARSLGLKHDRNVYETAVEGSIWNDSKGRQYRVKEVYRYGFGNEKVSCGAEIA